MQKYVVYFTLTAGKKSPLTGCMLDDCYLCPFKKCARIGGSIRAEATPAALSFLRQKRPHGVIVEKLMTKEEAEAKWRL